MKSIIICTKSVTQNCSNLCMENLHDMLQLGDLRLYDAQQIYSAPSDCQLNHHIICP